MNPLSTENFHSHSCYSFMGVSLGSDIGNAPATQEPIIPRILDIFDSLYSQHQALCSCSRIRHDANFLLGTSVRDRRKDKVGR